MAKLEVDMGPKLGKHSDRIMKAVWIIIGVAVVVMILSVVMMFMMFQKLPF